MARVDYSITLISKTDKVLILRDDDLGNRSLTNGIEDVLEEVSVDYNVDLSGWGIAYLDSDKTFTGVHFKKGEDVDFYPIPSKDVSDVYDGLLKNK